MFCFCVGCHPWRWHPAPSGALILVVSDRAWPLSDEGHKSSALCIVGWPRQCWRCREADAVSAILCFRTRSATLGSAASFSPASLNSLVDRGHLLAPGSQLPPPLCARHGVGTMFAVVEGIRRWQGCRRRRSPFVGFGWLAAWGRCWLVGFRRGSSSRRG